MTKRYNLPLATRHATKVVSKPAIRLRRAVRFGLFSLPLALALAGSTALTATAQEAGRRVALVIGNQDYQYVEPLVNPQNDTKEI